VTRDTVCLACVHKASATKVLTEIEQVIVLELTYNNRSSIKTHY